MYLRTVTSRVVIADYVKFKVDRMPKGFVFTCDTVQGEVRSKEAVIKALNRLVEKGVIKKLAKGRYYKPELTPFGNLLPAQAQVVKDLMEYNGKLTGYLTGFSIFNELGLSTQVSDVIQVGRNDIRPAIKRDRYRISFIHQKNPITTRTIPLLQVLDAIRYIRKIPDTTLELSCLRLTVIIRSLSDEDVWSLVRLSMKYPPSTRALLGAILEVLNKEGEVALLRKSLNAITRYKLPGAEKALVTAPNWNLG